MTADPLRSSQIVPVHWSVPGRLRVRIVALRRSPEDIERFLRQVLRDNVITEARANRLTGTVLVHYRTQFSPDEILGRLVAAADCGTSPGPVGDERWHALSVDDALALTRGVATGLGARQAGDRLKANGPNRLPVPRRRGLMAILAGQFSSLPVILLLGSAVTSVVTGAVLEAGAILAVVALNGIIGARLEVRSERMIAQLDRHDPRTALVRRDGQPRTVEMEDIVVGDILLLAPGMLVAADARVIEDSDLSLDEAVLTGESQPVAKHAGLVMPPSSPLVDRANMIWRGTLVSGGQGAAVVVATGRKTELGRIQALVGDLSAPQTPMQRELDRLGRALVWASLGLCGATVLIGVLRGVRLVLLWRSTIALAVASVPEGLPTVATLTFAQAIRRLNSKGVLVRRLEAVESLGVVSVVFFDKTGTLTLNRMTVADVSASPDVGRMWQVAGLCSDAKLQRGPDGAWQAEGSPTEKALVMGALDYGIDVEGLRSRIPRLSERYRDERRQTMVTIHDSGGGRRLIAVKGSPLDVLAGCQLSDADRQQAEQCNDSMARRGLRVLGFACAETAADEDWDGANLTWLGLVALADPIRPGAPEILAELKDKGVETIMLTGDQAATAEEVARRLNMLGGDGTNVADATEVEILPLDTLAKRAREARVFARIQPAHKLRVVQAVRESGRVVAMVGDGVNDSPALRAADIGITMGRRGAAAARDLSDLVLEDDDIRTLDEAIREGRLTHANIGKSVRFLVTTNLSEILFMIAATALGVGGALSPLQLLWINLVTDVFPALALDKEPGQEQELSQAGAEGGFLSREEVPATLFRSATIAAGALGAFTWGGGLGGSARASTLATTSLVVGQMLNALTTRSHQRWGGGPNPSLGLAIGATLLAQTAGLAVPVLGRALGLVPLDVGGFAAAAMGGLGSYLVNEAWKPGSKDGGEQHRRAPLQHPVQGNARRRLGHLVQGTGIG